MNITNYLVALAIGACVVGSAQAESISVSSCGEQLEFESVPERVVVHDKNLTELLLTLGLRDRIVGVTGITGWYGPSDELAAAIDGIPELNPKDPVLENILSVGPDFFFAGWYYGMQPDGPVTPVLLEPFGIKTYVLSESCVHVGVEQRPSLELLYGDVRALGSIFGVQDRAEVLLDSWSQRVDVVRLRLEEVEPARVFMHYDGEATPFTAGGLGMVQTIFEAAGGANIMADLEVNWGETSWEVVASRNPEFIVIFDDQTGEGPQRQVNVLKANPLMSQLDAVINERFVVVQYREIAPGPGNIEAIERIAKFLHPQVFE
ncbi:MAG: ABC transporter substrate-binding protein [Roseovarius confluentis]|uniref:ABC transporter substrate-binding protein n=1 Tax=Roseovarius sp. TaxID=1486281 RepID=UPI0032EE9E79